jgi:CDP-diacylglycerol--serine O-phosphatidyltransferase
MKPESGRRGIYLLPNLFTTAALFAGFFAVVAARNNRFEAAAVSIFIAMILDGMDGRIARMTNTQSEFGAEYDSLSDMLSFGLAPALVAYEWCLYLLGKVGWLAAFFYVASAALRLARFNATIGVADKRYFQGLPSPAAAALVAGLVWLGHDAGLDANPMMHMAALLLTVLASLLMVSNIRYYSFKQINLRDRVPFVAILAVVLLFVLISLDPSLVLFSLFALYALSGPVVTLTLLRRHRAARRAGQSTAKDDETDPGP